MRVTHLSAPVNLSEAVHLPRGGTISIITGLPLRLLPSMGAGGKTGGRSVRKNIFPTLIAAASLAAVTPVAASAQDVANNADTYSTAQPQEDDDDFPWGLLGLLGLAGLLGLKRRDDRVDVDNRTRR
jgi:hypothetical protein